MGTVESLQKKSEEAETAKRLEEQEDADLINEMFDSPTEVFLHFDRTGVEGIENKSDALVILDWLKQSFQSAMVNGADPITHFIINRIMAKFDNLGDRQSVVLNAFELAVIRWSLLSTRPPGQFNKMFCVVCRIFGLSL